MRRQPGIDLGLWSTGNKRSGKEREGASAGRGRGTREELGLPVTNLGARLKDRGGTFKLDQNNDGSGVDGRDGRVHDHTERAVVGIAAVGVQMGHLGDGQESQQAQTQNRDRRQGDRPVTAIPEGA